MLRGRSLERERDTLTPEELQVIVQAYLAEPPNALSTVDGLRSLLHKCNIIISDDVLDNLFLQHAERSQAANQEGASYSLSCGGLVSICAAIKSMGIKERLVTRGGAAQSNNLLSRSGRRVAFGESGLGGADGAVPSRQQFVERLLSAGELADRYAEADLMEALKEEQPPAIPHDVYEEISIRSKTFNAMKAGDRSGKLVLPHFALKAALRNSKSSELEGIGISHLEGPSPAVLKQYTAVRRMISTPINTVQAKPLSLGTSVSMPTGADFTLDTDAVDGQVMELLAGLTTEDMSTLAGVERAVMREKASMGLDAPDASFDPMMLYPYVEFASDMEGLDEGADTARPGVRFFAVEAILSRIRGSGTSPQGPRAGLLSSPFFYAKLTPEEIHSLVTTSHTNVDSDSGEPEEVDPKAAPSEDTPTFTGVVTYAQLADMERRQMLNSDITSKSKSALAELTACGVRPEDELEGLKVFRAAAAAQISQRREVGLRQRHRSFRRTSFDAGQLVEESVTTPPEGGDQRVPEPDGRAMDKVAAMEAHLFLSPTKAATLEGVANRRDESEGRSSSFVKSMRSRRRSFHGGISPARRDSDTTSDPQAANEEAAEFEQSQSPASDDDEHDRDTYPLLMNLKRAVAAFAQRQRGIEEAAGLVTERPHGDGSASAGRSPVVLALGSRHARLQETSELEASIRSASLMESNKGKLYRDRKGNLRRWEELRHIEDLKLQEDGQRKKMERDQTGRLATAFSPCDMPYDEFYFVPQLQHRPKEVPLFLRKSFSPAEPHTSTPIHSEGSKRRTPVASLKSPHRYQTTLDRTGEKYFVDDSGPLLRRRTRSVYHHGIRLEHSFLRPLAHSPSASPKQQRVSQPETKPGRQSPPKALSPELLTIPTSHGDAEERVRVHGRVGKQPLYPQGVVGCSLLRTVARSSTAHRAHSTPPLACEPTAPEPATRPATAVDVHFPRTRPATPVPAGVRAIMSQFIVEATEINSRPTTAAHPTKTTHKGGAPVYRLPKGAQRPIGFNM